jgi:methylated-DNA-protein-cysteine methyltransferase related protein
MVEQDGFAQRVLDAVGAIPAGRVLTYGDVAEYAGIRSPRSVGQVLAADGGTVPWHRVLRHDGSMAPHIRDEQRERLRAEGVHLRGDRSDRVDLALYRWDGASTSAE